MEKSLSLWRRHDNATAQRRAAEKFRVLVASAFLSLELVRCDGSSTPGNPPSQPVDAASNDGPSVVTGDFDATGEERSDADGDASGGSGGASDAASSNDVVSDARASACTVGRGVLSGTLGAVPWMQTYATQNKFAAYDNRTRWQYFVHLDKDGLVVLRGEGANSAKDGAIHSIQALLLTPTAGPDPHAWYTSTLDSTVLDDPIDTRIDIAGLAKLGSCDDGTAAAGEIAVCSKGATSQECWFKRSGTLDGMTIGEAEWIGTAGTSSREISLAFADGMIIKFDADNLSGPITHGLVILGNGAIYCAGASSTHVHNSTSDDLYTLRDFKRVPNSAGVTGAGTMSGCVGQAW